jgi:hypothetical protein
MNEMPLGVGVVVAGLAVALLLVGLIIPGSFSMLTRSGSSRRLLCCLWRGRRIEVADDAVQAGTNEVGHLGGLWCLVSGCSADWICVDDVAESRNELCHTYTLRVSSVSGGAITSNSS